MSLVQLYFEWGIGMGIIADPDWQSISTSSQLTDLINKLTVDHAFISSTVLQTFSRGVTHVYHATGELP